jgi:parallel beta-helix repeat protein
MKSRAILWLMLSSALVFVGCSSTTNVTPQGPILTPSGTQISGPLTGTLSAANSPYWVTSDLSVDPGQSLTIEPGVELRFDDLNGQRYMFLVKGHLSAVGTANQNIIFTSMSAALGSPDRGQWRSIVFDTGSDTSELAYCQIKYGAVYDSTVKYPDANGLRLDAAIMCWNSSPYIHKCSVLVSGYHGIYCVGLQSQPRIIDNNIIENDGDGIRCVNTLGNNAPPIAQPVIWYTNSQENNGQQWADCPAGTGDRLIVNANGDSCDTHFNFSVDPMYADLFTQSYELNSCSACISAASDGGTIGSIPYYIGATELRGNIGGRVITAAQNPWYVTCNIRVAPGSTLTLEPQALVLVKSTYSLSVMGRLEADGAVFMPEDSTNIQAKWMGITFMQGSDPGSYVRNCTFRETSSTIISAPYAGTITVRSCAPEISGNSFIGSEYAAVSCLDQAQPLIQGNTIYGFGPMGINCYNNSHPVIRQNRIYGGVGYGILCSFTSSPLIESNLVYGTQLWGIKCDNGSSPVLHYNTIANNAYGGILVTQESNPEIAENVVAFNYTGSIINGHGCNLQVIGSSLPVVSYNDFFQPDTAYDLYSGFAPDLTNITADPQFVNATAQDYHLQAGSPAKTAGPEGHEIGAYGLSDW